ncbi:hypothetical protein RclHR1_02280019 [Rhizophagus clarus]|uniref:BTB domain-containing protein n=1 Tax=Rhizophagus clarus TaxID=94130 RepID=A0A2Z6RP67_9GLOM|nr:hypothetical protein RclHR1_02280019 [Rhizophagus clarus]GES75738.1 hypothetical protein GLOIN_2v1606685 [Rhizophagus clarus]
MTRGSSITQDFKDMIDNPQYSDIEIFCEDGVTLYGSRAVLAARSEVFNGLLFNGMKETFQRQISFPEIKSCAMKIILEFLYTGSIEEVIFDNDNLVETNLAADYFQLPDLQKLIIENLKEAFEEQEVENQNTINNSPELLSVMISKIPFHEIELIEERSVDDQLLNFLADSVARIHFDDISLSKFSIQALKYVLSYTYNFNKPFATPEYLVFRFAALLAAHNIDLETYNLVDTRLPDLDVIEESLEEEIEFNNKCEFNRIRPKIYQFLLPIIKFIDFRRIDGKILSKIIEPLGLIPNSIIIDAYRYYSTNKKNLPATRGMVKLYWDEGECGGHIYVISRGSVATTNHQYYENIKANFDISNNGTYEWDIFIEEIGQLEICVGVHANSKFNYDLFGGCQKNTWLLSSAGMLYSHTGNIIMGFKFGKGDRITLQLNMDKHTLVFSFNGQKLFITELKKKSRYYPIISLNHPARVRLFPHLKYV